ncbi:MAG: hypothetical protein P0121_04685 [Nitrospira sp.]|nr:hypothetical protein [Nitrospira sp.]
MSDIDTKYTALGGPGGWLGQPTSPELAAPDGIGRYRHFQGGSIYWSPSTGAHEVHGAIRVKWASLGWERSFLSYPLTDESTTPDGVGRYNHFQGGSIYWTPSTGAHEVHGAIRGKWASLGWERSFLGYPLTDESTTPDGVGRYNHFQGGSIYWTPSTDAHEVHGAIRGKWASLGWERSFLGYPLTDESTTPDGVGRYNHFQGGSIYWTPSTDAHEVHGAIRGKWASLGWERSFLGYPLTDESTTPDGVGRYNHFQGGSIYWTPSTGAHEVHGAIRGKWASLGWERSFLGYPTSDELSTEDGTGRYSEFQHGSIYWSPATGALVCKETIRLHVKCLTAPTRFSINTMISNMRLTFATAQVGVKYVSFEVLSLADLNDLDVGACTLGSTTTEQTQLFSHRNSAGANDIVVYFVRSTVPPFNGCASHPTGRPGAVVASGASQWTMAHEVGHVLGIHHVNDSNRLMTGGGTDNITNPPPDIIASESATMLGSALTN